MGTPLFRISIKEVEHDPPPSYKPEISLYVVVSHSIQNRFIGGCSLIMGKFQQNTGKQAYLTTYQGVAFPFPPLPQFKKYKIQSQNTSKRSSLRSKITGVEWGISLPIGQDHREVGVEWDPTPQPHPARTL